MHGVSIQSFTQVTSSRHSTCILEKQCFSKKMLEIKMLYLHSQIASEPSNAHFRFSFSFMSAYAFSLTSSSRIWVEHASNLFHHIHLYVQVYYSEFHWVPSATHFVFTHSTLGSCSLASPAAFSFLHYSTRCKAFSVFLLGLVSNNCDPCSSSDAIVPKPNVSLPPFMSA